MAPVRPSARWRWCRRAERVAADHVIIGSGINALVAAAMLARKGQRVLVLEREDRIGGCMCTEEVTLPGFHHDVMATTFVLFLTSPAYAALAGDLARHGFEFCHTAHPTAVLRPDGTALVLTTDRAAQRRRAQRAGARRRRPPRGRCRRDRGRGAVPVRAAGRLALVLAHAEADDRAGPQARAARADGLVRRGPGPGARLAGNLSQPDWCRPSGRPGCCIPA